MDVLALKEGVWVCPIGGQGGEEVGGCDMTCYVKRRVYVHENQHVCDDCVVKPLCFREWGVGYQALQVIVGDCAEVAKGWVNGM